MLTAEDVVHLIGSFYLWLAGLSVVITVLFAGGAKRKAILGVLVFALFAIWPMTSLFHTKRQINERMTSLNDATRLFAERCKTAGEKMKRTVQNVQGVVWLKWRPEKTNFGDQFKLDDPYGRDCGGEDCILRLLKVTKGAELNPDEAQRHAGGFTFIESIDPADNRRYRYVGVMKPAPSWTQEAIERANKEGKPLKPHNYRFSLERQPIDRFTARYGITWDDISTREDREHWIAGGSLKIIDLQTNEIIAERVGFLFDTGLGNTEGSRSPWTWAKSYVPGCPSPADHNGVFVNKVLQPTNKKE